MERLRRILWKIYKLDLTDQIEDIREVLTGFGGSCEVFIGRYPRLRKKVAIKRLRIFLQKEDQFAEKLTGEIYIWSKLDHPNVLQFLGFYLEDSGFPNLVSEWMENGTLFDYMPRIPRGVAALNVIIGIAEGLSYLHSMGVIHADLKSSNVLISNEGTPLLADFGVSRVLSSSITMMATSGNSTKGTVRWMAIELLDLADDDDDTPVHNKQTDIWAFGMVAYELLARKVPFAHLKADIQVVMAITRGKVPVCPTFSEDVLVSGIEQQLWQLCEQCWKPKPASRPSLSHLLTSLRKALPDSQVDTSSGQVVTGYTSNSVKKEDGFRDSSSDWSRSQEWNDSPSTPRVSFEAPEFPLDDIIRLLTRPRGSLELQRYQHGRTISPTLVDQGTEPSDIQTSPVPPPPSSPVSVPKPPESLRSRTTGGRWKRPTLVIPTRLRRLAKQLHPVAVIPHPDNCPPLLTVSPESRDQPLEQTHGSPDIGAASAGRDFFPRQSNHEIYYKRKEPPQYSGGQLDNPTPQDLTPAAFSEAVDQSNGADFAKEIEDVTLRVNRPPKLFVAIPERELSLIIKPTFRWVCGEPIGKGRNYNTHLAINTTTGVLMVVKQVGIPKIDSGGANSRQFAEAKGLKNESEILEDLNHPNIVKFLESEQTAENLRLFTEYVPGASLAEYLQKYGKFEDEVTRSFTGQILAGLEYLHDKGILHRYIKTGHILISSAGICKIRNFSMSKRTANVNEYSCRTPQQGSASWMAPEVAMAGESQKGYNAKADVWSVGCLVLHMWSGYWPSEDVDVVDVLLELVIQKHIPSVHSDVALSSEADDFRKKCLALKPDDRPSPTELRKHPYLTLPPDWKFTGFRDSPSI